MQIPRWRTIATAYLSVIMTKATIMGKIYLTSIFQMKRRNESARHHWNTHKYTDEARLASFQIQSDHCMTRVFSITQQVD